MHFSIQPAAPAIRELAGDWQEAKETFIEHRQHTALTPIEFVFLKCLSGH